MKRSGLAVLQVGASIVLLVAPAALAWNGDAARKAEEIVLKKLATFPDHKDDLTTLCFSPDGKLLASGDGSGAVRLWEVPSGKLRTRMNGSVQQNTGLAFSPRGEIIAVLNNGLLQLWDVNGARAIGALRRDTWTVAFSPDGRTLAMGGGTSNATTGIHGRVWLWDIAKAQERVTATIQEGQVFALDYSPDGKTLAVGTGDGNAAHSALWYSGTLKLFDADSLKVLHSVRAHSSWVTSVRFSPGGSFLATGSSNPRPAVRLWDLQTRSATHTIRGLEDNVRAIAFTPDGKVMAAACGRVKISDVSTGQELVDLSRQVSEAGGACVAVSPDGKLIAAGSINGAATLWEIIRSK